MEYLASHRKKSAENQLVEHLASVNEVKDGKTAQVEGTSFEFDRSRKVQVPDASKKPRGREKLKIVVVAPNSKKVECGYLQVLRRTEGNTFDNFNESMERVFKNFDEDINFSTEGERIGLDERLHVLEELKIEVAKLKVQGLMEMIPAEKLVKLLNILDICIKGGDRVSPFTGDGGEAVQQMRMERIMKKILRVTDACLICLYILSAPNMPKHIFVEDVIGSTVLFIKYHMHSTIFPSYDSFYTVVYTKEGGCKEQSRLALQTGVGCLYNKTTEIICLLAQILKTHILTDTTVLHIASVCVSPFFVGNVGELQLACLKLTTAFFVFHKEHHVLLTNDIVTSLTHLPCTKQCFGTYFLNTEGNVQMLTALVLQLIQCTVALPENVAVLNENVNALVYSNLEKATSIAETFLPVFFNTRGKSGPVGCQRLFQNFTDDLLSTLNRPEWPATELVLNLLINRAKHFSAVEDADVSLRAACLNFLGLIAARFKRDEVFLEHELARINRIITQMKFAQTKKQIISQIKVQPERSRLKLGTEEEKREFLQRALLDFLAVSAQNDESIQYARHFHIARWYKEAVGAELQVKEDSKTKNSKNRKRRDSCEDKANDDKSRSMEMRRQFLFDKLQENFSTIKVSHANIHYDDAKLVAQYLSSLLQDFEQCLKTVLLVLKDKSILIRTKAVRSLATIAEADATILSRCDVQMGINSTFVDQSASVREVAVDLVGKYALQHPALTTQYCEMLLKRTVDTSVGVRKRVVKIFKDVLLKYPAFPKIPEICVAMIRRINDQDDIRRTVVEIFRTLWFVPTKVVSSEKVTHMIDFVASSEDVVKWFEQLLFGLCNQERNTKGQLEARKSCEQIVDCVVKLAKICEQSDSFQTLIACFKMLCLFARVRPQLLVPHARTVQHFLSSKYQSRCDTQTRSSAADILQLVVPLMNDSNASFFARLEDDCVKLVFKEELLIVSSCIACLGCIVNKITHNFKIIRDCFCKLYGYVSRYKDWVETELNNDTYRRCFRTAVFSVGLLLRHFNFQNPEVIGDLPKDIVDQVFNTLLYFLRQGDVDIQECMINAVGVICARYGGFMFAESLKRIYLKMLTTDGVSQKIKSEILVNIELYLVEDSDLGVEDSNLGVEDSKRCQRAKDDDLKKMDSLSSDRASTVVQFYLKGILHSYLHSNIQVRQPAVKVVQLILQQGLANPIKIVPYLICMSTDCEETVSHSADNKLLEIEQKYPGFIQTKSLMGLKLSYDLQKIFQANEIVRGFSIKEHGGYPTALNGYLYSILRNSKQQRNGLVLNILRQFGDQADNSLAYMLYLADNLAHFPYMLKEEPLFIVHQIDVMTSIVETNLLQGFITATLESNDGDVDALAECIPEDASHLQAAQSYILLLLLKQYLEDVYSLNDGKVQQHSLPEPASTNVKAVSRRNNAYFNPEIVFLRIKQAESKCLDLEGRKDLVRQYLDLKQLMARNSDDEDKVLTVLGSAATVKTPLSKDTALSNSEVTVASVTNHNTDVPPKTLNSYRRTVRKMKQSSQLQKSPEKCRKRKRQQSKDENFDY